MAEENHWTGSHADKRACPQIAESFTAYGKYTPIKNTVIYGGVGQGSQTDASKEVLMFWWLHPVVYWI